MNDLPDKALLPTGMQDGLPPDAAREAKAVERLLATFAGWGYARVKPPLMEFEDSLLGGSGQAVAAATFRLQDPASKRMLALRADQTLQVARIARSRLGQQPRPLRLAYGGEVVRIAGSQQRPERQFFQVGAELIGDENAAGDVEMIAMALEALEGAGIKNLTVDIGLPKLTRLLMDGVSPDDATAERLKTALERKDTSDLDALSDAIGKDVSANLSALVKATGPAEAALNQISALSLGKAATAMVAQLKEVVEGLKRAHPNQSLTIDAVESRGFEYHSGVTFSFYANGVRGELGRGGRYLSDAPGNDKRRGEAATGLTLFMDTILRALPDSDAPDRIWLPADTALGAARELREQGWITVGQLDASATSEDEALTEAGRLGCTHILSGGKAKKLT